MKNLKRLLCMLLTLAIVFSNLSLKVKAAEYGQVILNPAEGTKFVTTDGQPLEDILMTFDGKEGYWSVVGNRLEFDIEVETGYKVVYESFTNADGGGSISYDEEKDCYYGIVTAGTNTIQTWSEEDDSYIGKNAITLTDDWQDEMFWTIGIAYRIAKYGNDELYFGDNESPDPHLVFWFLNSTTEIFNEGYTVNISYEKYMNIADAYFENVPDMKNYLVEKGYYDEETDTISYDNAGMGSAWEWVITDVKGSDEEGYYVFKGIFLSDFIDDETSDSEGLSEYVDYYAGMYIVSAIELCVVKDKEHGWRVAAYNELDYYVNENYEDDGKVLYQYNEETDNFSNIYYVIEVENTNENITVEFEEDSVVEIDGYICYSKDMTAKFNAVCEDGWTCQLKTKRTVDGEVKTGTFADSGVVYGGGSVVITVIPNVFITVESENATVEPVNGLMKWEDGVYVYKEGDTVEVKVTPEDGYAAENVLVYSYDNYVVFGQYNADTDTWALEPELTPSIIKVVCVSDESEGSDSGSTDVNENISKDSWNEKNLFTVFGFMNSGAYFTSEETPSQSTIFNFINMNLEEYLDEDWNYTLSYDQYMVIVKSYFKNYTEMKDYLIKYNHYNEKTDMVSIYSGGFGGGDEWLLTSTYEAEDGTYILQGLCLEISTTPNNYYDKYVEDDTTYYRNIRYACELTLTAGIDEDWKILSYEKSNYYIDDKYNKETHTYSDYGTMLFECDDETSEAIFYEIKLEDTTHGYINTTNTYTFKNNDSLWYEYSKGFNWELVTDEGYIGEVIADKYDWGTLERITQSIGTSGKIMWDCAVVLTPEVKAIYELEAEHADVEIKQGLEDLGDGTYAYSQTAAVELDITPEEGYKILEVKSTDKNGNEIYAKYISASGTWVMHPSFVPSTITVLADEVVVVESDDTSDEDVIVEVPVEYADKVEDLIFKAEKLESSQEQQSTAIIVQNVNAEEVYILDLHFENSEGEEVQVNTTMYVTLPIPEGWETDNLAVYYVNTETGEVTDMNAVVIDDNTVRFTTTHFSYYALVQMSDEKPFPFTDVYDYDWYKDYVNQAYQLGLMTGASETLFKPKVSMNRGMVAIVLHRMEGAEATTFETLFPDVKQGEYYAESVIWAKLKGVINGYGDGTFRPLRLVTREEMAQMIYNFAKYKGVDVSADVDLSSFLDGNKVSSWHKDAMMWANANGLITGKYNGTKLDPQGTATRAECCKMLVEAYKTIYK